MTAVCDLNINEDSYMHNCTHGLADKLYWYIANASATYGHCNTNCGQLFVKNRVNTIHIFGHFQLFPILECVQLHP